MARCGAERGSVLMKQLQDPDAGAIVKDWPGGLSR